MKSNSKIELRKKFLKLRKLIKNKKKKDEQIFQNLIHFPQFIVSKSLLVYASLADEVDTKEIIKYCWKNNKLVYIPFVKLNKIGKIRNFSDLEQYLHSKYLQPKIYTEKFHLDLIIIPGVVFDRNGNRIGTGNGWYDRFLKDYPNVLKVGIAYDEQISDETLPNEKYDIQLNFIITPTFLGATLL